MEQTTIIKCDAGGKEVWRYEGSVIRHTENSIIVEAHFNRDDLPFHDIVFGKGDRFVEIYFSDRWYNIFEIHDRSDDQLKAWYCNVTYPAMIGKGIISYADLALDLLVYPDGRQLVLDEDEFAALEIEPADRQQALLALEALQYLFVDPPDLKNI